MSTTSVLYKVRRTLGDFGYLFTDQIGGDGVTQAFDLTETTVEPTTVVVTLQPAGGGAYTAVPSSAYTLDPRNGSIIMNTPPTDQQVLIVTGVAYEDYTDEDLLDYIGTALDMHTSGRSPQPVLDAVAGAIPPTNVLDPVEERPLALLAASLAVKDLATQVAKDITIDTGDGTVIPRSQRYQQLVAEAARLDGDYQNLVDRLGLPGFEQISVVNLRRVSMTTGRLVPVYREREWDDRLFPQRVMPAVPTGALPTDRLITYTGNWILGHTYNRDQLTDKGGIRYLCLADGATVDPEQDVRAGNGWQGQFWEISFINAGMFGWATGAW